MSFLKQIEEVMEQLNQGVVGADDRLNEVLGDIDNLEEVVGEQKARELECALEAFPQKVRNSEEFRLKKAEEKRLRKERNNRRNVANAFSQKGETQAAAALENFESEDIETLEWVVRELQKCFRRRAVPQEFVSIVSACVKQAEQRLEKAREDSTIEVFLRFMREIETAQSTIRSADRAPKKAHPSLLKQARQAVGRACKMRLEPWQMAFIEKLIDADNNPVSASLVKNEEVAISVGLAEPRRKSATLLRECVRQAENEVNRFQEELDARKQDPSEVEAERNQRRQRARARAKECADRKGPNVKINPPKKDKGGKRAKNDPKNRKT